MPRTVLVTVYAIGYFLIMPLTPCGLSRGREVFSFCGALIGWPSPAFNKHLSFLLWCCPKSCGLCVFSSPFYHVMQWKRGLTSGWYCYVLVNLMQFVGVLEQCSLSAVEDELHFLLLLLIFSGSGALKKAEMQRGVMAHSDILALEENVCGLLWQVGYTCCDSSDVTACLPEGNIVTFILYSPQPSSEILLSSSC